MEKTESEWKEALTEEEYRVMRKKGTETAFTGKYCNHHEEGIYLCAACNTELFSSKTKYDSKSGWPSFYQAIGDDRTRIEMDKSWGMIREEILCSNCGSHLGHRFPDGPQPTGQRYCINSVALKFIQKKEN